NGYRIQNVNSGKVLDVANSSTSNGANVQQYSDGGGDNQRFHIHDQGSGQYHIQPVHSDMAVEVESGSTSDGANVQQYDWNGNGNQLWTFQSP
ncbi:RICIN domain-containing protein, partial [Halobacteria archaeon HArc-gm2]|nr:RICIN domain-containing protein [Halobacteria archaeon HArc-gm2]